MPNCTTCACQRHQYPNGGQCSVQGPWPHTLQTGHPQLHSILPVGDTSGKEWGRSVQEQTRSTLWEKALPQSMENTFSAPCQKHTKRRWLIPSDWSCLRRTTGTSPASQTCGLCSWDFWDTHLRLEFVTKAPQDTHTPWYMQNNTRPHPSSLPRGVIHPCGRTAYPCQERLHVLEQVSEQFSAWDRSPGPSWSRGRHCSPHQGLGMMSCTLGSFSPSKRSPAHGDHSWTQECIKREEPPPGQGQWPGSSSTSREGQTPSPARLHKSLPGCAWPFFPSLKEANRTTLVLEAWLLVSYCEVSQIWDRLSKWQAIHYSCTKKVMPGLQSMKFAQHRAGLLPGQYFISFCSGSQCYSSAFHPHPS